MKEIKELWAHQKMTIEMARPLDFFLIANGPGTGKSRTVIEILRAKYAQKGRLMRTLIICPPIVIDNWRDEWLKYSQVPGSYITGLTGTGKQRLNTLREKGFDGDKPRPHIFTSNYEIFQMDELVQLLHQWKPEAIVFDEAHRLKDYRRTAVRAQAAFKLANPGTKKDPLPRPLVYLLTGTPYPNSLLDIFMPYRVMDGGATFGSTMVGFRDKYFRDKNANMPKDRYFPKWVPLEGAKEELGRKMKGTSVHVPIEACLDLPPVVVKTIAVEMAPEQRRMYREMLQEFVATFERDGETKTSVATMAMVKGLRLMQIASGYVKDDQGGEHSVTQDEWTPKQEALKQILEDWTPGHKVIVWAVWKHNYEQIREVCRRLKIQWLEMNGESGAKKNRENAKLFEESEDYRVIIGHPESGGEGINLVSSPCRVSYSRNFSWRQMKQSDARNFRGGSERHSSITRINLVTKGTVEEKITEKLANHEEITETVLREIALHIEKETT